MILRAGTKEDTPQIVDLLKVSLGESLMPKSEAFWSWKHLENPFGQSPVLVAEEHGKLVGVRTFLRWEFQQNNQILKACRAVDTAIHPDFQGKGLFKKLTTTLLKKLEKEGTDLIFNSPNKQSMPGYLKMGWEKWGKLPLKIQIHFGAKKNTTVPTPDWEQVQGLTRQIEQSQQAFPQVKTHLKQGYLTWRYTNCPVSEYNFISDQESYLMIYRIKPGKWGPELRISELFTLKNFGKEKTQQLRQELKHIQKINGVRFTSLSGLDPVNQQILKLGSIPVLSLGPLLTLRQMKPELAPRNLNWNWSLGDLEIF